MGRKRRKKLDQRERSASEPDPSMRRRKKWTVGVLLALLIVGGGGAVAWLQNRTAAKFEQAPRFTLQASTGRIISLEDYLDRQEVVLLFYMIHT